MDTGARRGERGASGVPAEPIVPASGLSGAGFYKSEAGKQPPIEAVIVCRFQEDLRVVFRGTAGTLEKALKRLKPRVFPVIGGSGGRLILRRHDRGRHNTGDD